MAQPTEQWVQMVRLTSTLPAPVMDLAVAACAFCTKLNWDAAKPTPTPKPERRKKLRRSRVGKACDKPRRKLWMKGDDVASDVPEDFLVSNMEGSSWG
jgi:hypothetical protein